MLILLDEQKVASLTHLRASVFPLAVLTQSGVLVWTEACLRPVPVFLWSSQERKTPPFSVPGLIGFGQESLPSDLQKISSPACKNCSGWHCGNLELSLRLFTLFHECLHTAVQTWTAWACYWKKDPPSWLAWNILLAFPIATWLWGLLNICWLHG